MKPTNELRWKVVTVHHNSQFKGGPGWDEKVKQLQQKWVCYHKEECYVEWRPIPDAEQLFATGCNFILDIELIILYNDANNEGGVKMEWVAYTIAWWAMMEWAFGTVTGLYEMFIL